MDWPHAGQPHNRAAAAEDWEELKKELALFRLFLELLWK